MANPKQHTQVANPKPRSQKPQPKPNPAQATAADTQHRTKINESKNLADRPSEKPRRSDRTNTETVVQADSIDTQDYQKILIPKRQIPTLCKNFIQGYYAKNDRIQRNHPLQDNLSSHCHHPQPSGGVS
jgi:hypothetical protein